MKSFLILFAINSCLWLSSAHAELNILAVGDTGKGNPEQFQVGRAMTVTCREIQCSFGLLLGDNVYDVGIDSPTDPQMRDKFERPYAEFPVPFYVALGNHDYGRFANEWKKGDYQIEYGKKNPKFVLPSHYYSFEKENVLFIVIDTSRYFHNKDIQIQTRFIKETLNKSTARWKVVVGHHPYISNGKHGNAGRYDGVPFPPYSGIHVKDLVEKELCGKVDLFISGHDHNLQTIPGTGKCASTLFVVSGSGASGDDEFENRNAAIFHSPEIGFSSLTFNEDEMIIRHHSGEGKVLHTHSQRRAKSFLEMILDTLAP